MAIPAAGDGEQQVEVAAVSIVIVNYHLSAEILACLDSLERHLPAESYSVVVVDNASNDAELDTLRERVRGHTGWRFVELQENIGFGAACNRGARESESQWLCFLNPDTRAESDFVACLLEAVRENGAAVAGPAYGPRGLLEWNTGVFPGPLLEFCSIAMLGRPLEALWMGLRRRLAGNAPMSVDWILGACMLMPRATFERSGGFDESFFLYYEEMDLCRRLRDTGGRILFVPGCRIHHAGGVSGRRDYHQFTRRFYQGKLNYLHKHYRGIMRSLMRAIVWAQLQCQGILWRIPGIAGSTRAAGKRAGVADALDFYHRGLAS